MTLVLKNFALAGYRSFGKQTQYFDRLSKINLLIGRNNAGKSNVIRFLMEIYPKGPHAMTRLTNPLDAHFPEHADLLVGFGEVLEIDAGGIASLRRNHPLLKGLNDTPNHTTAKFALSKLFAEKKKLDGTELVWSLVLPFDHAGKFDSWEEVVKSLKDHEISTLWSALTNMSGGARTQSWEPDILRMLTPDVPSIQMALIPAVREIGAKGSESDGFDGKGIIERLARLQNPDVHSQHDRIKFKEITKFVGNVIDNPTASIEVPHDRETILVHMDGKTLPLSSLGSGIHEVIILAAAATVLSDHLICIEEPEIHLNPILQRKLMRYLSEFTSNQYIISTHSAALMDTPDAEIYHIRLENGCSIVERATTNNQKSAICEDLGFHPSDLLQANCVIWVEGPSDRVYLNYWITSLEPNFVEGIHYSIMFYGGRLASHLSNDDDETLVSEFISLRRLNRRGVMILDSDRDKPSARINETKRRLEKEFNSGPGHAWITKGREIENYLPPSQIRTALSVVKPNATAMSSFGTYENILKIKSKKGQDAQAPKVEIARYIVSEFQPDLSVLDLRVQLNKLINFIKESNPASTL